MNDTPHEIWFYSRDGERCGPVSFTDLRAKAKDASLNPRLDLVWTHGMDEWKPAGEIDGLFRRRASTETQESPAASPYSPPQQASPAEQMNKEGNWPGARRRSYLIATTLGLIGFYALGAGEGFLTAQLGAEIMKYALPAMSLVPWLVIIYFSLMRLVNLGMSRWWFLGNLVPFLNFWVGYRCFACPAGYAYHKKLDAAGIFLAIVYWLLLAIGLLAVAALIAVMLGVLDSPEIKQQILDAIRAATPPKA